VRSSVAALFVVLFIFVAGSALAEVPANDPSTASTALPRLSVPETTFDFGKVRQGAQVVHEFLLRNSGLGPLKIERMHTSCGCTAAVIDSDTILPRAETHVKATFDTSGFQGQKMKTVRLYTNDPKQPSVLLALQGIVEPDVTLSASRVQFGDLRRGEGAVQQIVLSAPKSLNVVIQDATSRSPFLDVTNSDFTQGDQVGKKLRIQLKTSAPVGVFRDRVIVHTTSANNPVVNIPVFAKVQGDLQLVPSVVSFGLIDKSKAGSLSRTVQLQSLNPNPLKILSVESDNQSINATVITMSDGKSTGIKVTVDDELTGAFRARVKITTDHADPDQRQLVLPVYGILSEPK